MLSITQVNNATTTVYTCPSGHNAFVFVDTASNSGSSVSFTINVNGTLYWTGSTNFISAKLVLTSGDTVSVSTTSVVNVFVHGQVI